jgi:hypothetical protein
MHGLAIFPLGILLDIYLEEQKCGVKPRIIVSFPLWCTPSFKVTVENKQTADIVLRKLKCK